MKKAYMSKNFQRATLELIDTCNRIVDEYRDQGFDLTVRQLHYQLVSRDVYANTQRNYNRLGRVISDARMCGLVDWQAIVDRTRFVRQNNHWTKPEDIISASASQFYLSRWEYQAHYVEVWIEKDALVGVIEGVCRELDVPYFSSRGYSSQSAMWRAARRIAQQMRSHHATVIHLSDHDPSGIDMSRDLEERLAFFGAPADVKRLALTRLQIDQYNPPPNFAKEKDPRFVDYQRAYGNSSWELDALEPSVIADLIRGAITPLINKAKWEAVERTQKQHRETLRGIADRYWEVEAFLNWDRDDDPDFWQRIDGDY